MLVRAFVLVVLAVSAGEALAGTHGACDSDHIQCDNGQCAMPWLMCDGVKDCDDGSDEKPEKCNSAASTDMSVGDALTATIEYQQQQKGIIFRLCNDSSCSALYVWGANDTGTLKYFQDTDCNIWGAYCPTSIDSETVGWQYFPTSLMVFVLERTPSSLALWLVGDEEHSISVPVSDDSHHLHIRPEYWMTDMPVTLNVTATTVAPSTGAMTTPTVSVPPPTGAMTTPTVSAPPPTDTTTLPSSSTTPSTATRTQSGLPYAAFASLCIVLRYSC